MTTPDAPARPGGDLPAYPSARQHPERRPEPAAVEHKAPVAAFTGLLLLALLGGWLVTAPFLLGDQPRGARWTAATRTDVITGAVLAGAALAGLLGYLAAAVSWLSRYRR
jgi:hypothetical protein